MKIDLSLVNYGLYKNCYVGMVGGRLSLKTPLEKAVGYVGMNIAAIIADTPASDREEVTLTGSMSVWAYLIVFHAVTHAFSRVYDDGESGPVLIAANG